VIGWLRGEVIQRHEDGCLLVAVGGVGYEVFVPLGLWQRAPVGEAIELCVHTHVREDQLVLFGFASAEERALFRRLLQVSGVGAKTALALLSTFSLAELANAVQQKDAARIARAPGIGRKTAERIVLELQSSIAQWARSEEKAEGISTGKIDELRAALAQLGYRQHEIERVLAQIEPAPLDAMLRAALQALAR